MRSPAVVVVGDVVRLSPYAPDAIADRIDHLVASIRSPAAVRDALRPGKASSVTSSTLSTCASRSSAPVPPASTPATSSPTPCDARRGGAVAIDLFESLPAPYGLIRYGVAPDHPRIKGIVTSLHEMLDAGQPSASSATSRSAATSRSTNCRSATTP